MKKRRFFFLSFCLGYLFSCTPKADADAIPLLTPAEGETISIVSDGVKSYLCLQDAQKEADYLSKWSGTPFCDSQATSFSWKAKASGTYRVRFSTAKDLSNACTYLIEGNTLEEYTAFVPGERYYWQVEMGEMTDGAFVTHQKSKVGTFLVEENSLRPIGIEGAWNVRDIGGWKNEKGERVAYQKIYRGSRLNASENRPAFLGNGESVFHSLAIQTEIDLRTPEADDSGQSQGIMPNIQYCKAPILAYNYIFPDFSDPEHARVYEEKTGDSLRSIFRVLGTESSYPIYFHCNAGADRTGTLAYLIEGLLGVSEEDLVRDFELTSFSRSGKRWRSAIDSESKTFDPSGVMQNDNLNYVAFGKMNAYMKEKYGTASGNLKEAIENYLTQEFSIPLSQIETMRCLLLPAKK